MAAQSEQLLVLPAHYYRQHDVAIDWPDGGDQMLGWAVRQIEMPRSATALVCMHVANIGLDDRIPYGPGSPYAGWHRTIEYNSRAIQITRDVFPALLAAARGAGLKIIHTAFNEQQASQSAEYRRVKELAGPEPRPPDGAVADPRRTQCIRQRAGDARGEHNLADMAAGFKHIDFAPQAKPQPGEPVVVTTHQLNAVCREAGIWHLIYVGFALNVCLLSSPGGMVDMGRLGYVCSTIRQATTATENRETCHAELNKESALWRTALLHGYVFNLDDFTGALARITA